MDLRVRCKVLTWQELCTLLPEPLREFLDAKYGIVAPARPQVRSRQTTTLKAKGDGDSGSSVVSRKFAD